MSEVLSPPFKSGAFFSPIKNMQAMRFMGAMRSLVLAYDEFHPVSIIDPMIASDLGNQFASCVKGYKDAIHRAPETSEDFIAQYQAVGDAIKKSSVLLKNVEDAGGSSLENSEKIYGVAQAFQERADALTKGGWIKADNRHAKDLAERAQTYLEARCPELLDSKLLGLIYVNGWEIFARGMLALTFMEIQAERPGLFGKAYKKQPVCWWGVQLS